MMAPFALPSSAKNITARKLIQALKRDGFQITTSKRGALIFRHPDGRRVDVHFHRPGQTFPPKTLKEMLTQARWNLDDLKRLRLIPKRDP